MGSFRVEIEIGDSQGERWETVEALVDTGSSYTWAPAEMLGRLRLRPQFRREFETADGRVIEREMAVAMARWDGQALPTLVVFGDEGSSALLGVVTLEEFGLGVDPVNRRLIRGRSLAAEELTTVSRVMRDEDRELFLRSLLAATSPEYLRRVEEARGDYRQERAGGAAEVLQA